VRLGGREWSVVHTNRKNGRKGRNDNHQVSRRGGEEEKKEATPHCIRREGGVGVELIDVERTSTFCIITRKIKKGGTLWASERGKRGGGETMVPRVWGKTVVDLERENFPNGRKNSREGKKKGGGKKAIGIKIGWRRRKSPCRSYKGGGPSRGTLGRGRWRHGGKGLGVVKKV